MSKSLGNVVDPIETIDNLFAGKSDPLRYFLLRTGRMNSDSPFSFESLQTCYNSELAGNLGNLISRVFKRYTREEMASIPVIDRLTISDLDDKLHKLEERTNELYYKFQFGQVADLAMDILSGANRHISQVEPWKFVDARDHLNVASQISHVLKRVNSILFPIIPESSELIKSIFTGQKALQNTTGGIFPRLNKNPRGT